MMSISSIRRHGNFDRWLAPKQQYEVSVTQPGMSLDEIDTPALLVDLDRMESNIRSWQAAVSAGGAGLRPHTKTHKSPAIAKLQLAAGAAGITVAKLAEADVFADHGCDDIFVAYPIISPIKWRHAAALAHRCRLTVGVDSLAGARGLSIAAAEAGSLIHVRVEVEQGLNRSGVVPNQLADFCQSVLALPGIELDGIFTYRSVFFPGAAEQTAAQAGHGEGIDMVSLAEQLRAEGIPIYSVSVGSTPTAVAAAAVPGVTEVRPGTYVFGDYMMAARGVMSEQDIALSIMCTVVSRPAPDLATIDGGSKTFSGDIWPASEGLRGYARAADREAYLERMSEEHGMVRLGSGVDPQIGDRLSFYPIHVCPTVNLSDELIGIRAGRVEHVWPVLARGKRS
jgi:D-serine deaminase-like pyridoxal phosphate-dependent protein